MFEASPLCLQSGMQSHKLFNYTSFKKKKKTPIKAVWCSELMTVDLVLIRPLLNVFSNLLHYHPGVIRPRNYKTILYSCIQTCYHSRQQTLWLSGFVWLSPNIKTCLDVGYKAINDSLEHADYFHFTIAPFLLHKQFLKSSYQGSFIVICNTRLYI